MYSFLLEPRREDFERFRWNGAWLLASLLVDPRARRLLIEEPGAATVETLVHALDRCAPVALREVAPSEALAGLLARAAFETGQFTAAMTGLTIENRTGIAEFAAALDHVPLALRTSRGWLVGGVETHAEILGCAVLFEGPSPISSDPAPGLATLARLERIAAANPVIADLLVTPWPDWGTRGQAVTHGLKLLSLLETRAVQAWGPARQRAGARGPAGVDTMYLTNGKPEGFGVELADAVIRIMDLCQALHINLQYMVTVKMQYNESRPYRHGGKVC